MNNGIEKGIDAAAVRVAEGLIIIDGTVIQIKRKCAINPATASRRGYVIAYVRADQTHIAWRWGIDAAAGACRMIVGDVAVIDFQLPADKGNTAAGAGLLITGDGAVANDSIGARAHRKDTRGQI